MGEGKSGMLFFSSGDREYIVKTVTPNELAFLERELKSYYDYMVVNGATSLLPRFVGLYFLKLPDKVGPGLPAFFMVWAVWVVLSGLKVGVFLWWPMGSRDDGD